MDVLLLLSIAALFLFFTVILKPYLNTRATGTIKKSSILFSALFLIFFVLAGCSASDTSSNNAATKAENVHTSDDAKSSDKSKEDTSTAAITEDTKSTPSADTSSKDDSSKSTSTSTDSKTTTTETTAAPTKKPAVRKDLLPAIVTKNVDGDTIHVNLQGKDETIRMLLIDTPEDVDPRKPIEPYALDAAHYAASKLPVGKHIYIKEGIEKRDKYQRLLAYVYITPTDMYNVDVVNAGLARVGYIYNDKTYLSQLTAAQSSAKTAHKAIWSIPNYVDNANDRYNMQIACSWASNHQQSTRGCTAYQPSKPKTTTTKSSAVTTTHKSPVRSSTQSTTTSSTSSSGHKAGCNIKGSSTHIYHLPGDAYYDRTTHVVQWFCTEKEAQNAGYRASKR